MSRLDRAIAAAITLSLWAGLLLLVLPDRAAIIGHVWLVAVLALALGVALERLRREVPRRPSAFDAAFVARPPARARPASLARVEREVTLSTGTAFDVHFRLRPLLRSLAAGLLLRRGVDLERSPERAEAILGPDLWALVAPGVAAPDDRTAPGISIETVERSIDTLERVAWS
jgi:hypothetical protein